MKPINEMSLSECLESFFECLEAQRDGEWQWTGIRELTAIRLSQLSDRIHDLTRWIPVEERLPTEEDADENGEVLAYSPDPTITVSASSIPMSHHFTHWRRIDKPEGV